MSEIRVDNIRPDIIHQGYLDIDADGIRFLDADIIARTANKDQRFLVRFMPNESAIRIYVDTTCDLEALKSLVERIVRDIDITLNRSSRVYEKFAQEVDGINKGMKQLVDDLTVEELVTGVYD